MRDAFWLAGMQGGFKALLDCIKQFSEADFTDDLKAFDVPALIADGDDDQIVPIANAALRSVELVKNAELKIYKGGSHGLGQPHASCSSSSSSSRPNCCASSSYSKISA